MGKRLFKSKKWAKKIVKKKGLKKNLLERISANRRKNKKIKHKVA